MNPRLTLTSSVVGAVIVALDGTVLTVAQPTLQRDLGASLAQVQWTSTGYLIGVASLLVFAGRLGDRYGHHRVFGVGMLGFGAASAGIAVAPGAGWVIGLRVVQGVFGALLQPATLGMLRAAFPPDRLRTPIAVRTAAIGVAAAAGPVVGGALVAGPGWRAVFLLNVVPTVVFGVLALTVRGPRQASPVRLDLPGALLLGVALACLVHALVGLPGWGWTAATAMLTGAAFVRHERRAASPLLPPDVLGSAAVGSALGMLVAASAALSGTLFVATFLLQDTLGLDPVQSALRSLPLALLMVLAAPGCAVLLRRAGARRTTVAAMTVLALGILLLSRASATVPLCAAFALVGAGFGTVMVAATHVVVREATVESAGAAGGLQQTAMNIGPVLGVAVATALMGPDGARELPLVVLAALALAGAVPGRALPGRPGPTIDDHGRSADRAGVPAGR
ncbi:MFS transporter [Streptomyces sp. ISL-22]|uniref:MFS transporter n=1 Tax=unclassified Streptomyces TaxID=2593676 RepID=UPI001BE6DD7F|nr:MULTISPECIES: MFS transporter [unclassified Streptomyces]MBT2416574.1 MFS transporter [Streptomyces sp. ISL-24]MBT2433717.1 MFS transporter [Streptomyces sp. ISL-22]